MAGKIGARADKAPGRPRDAALDEAVHAAALRIARDEGYDRLSIERVAALSGVAKTSIYRRYRTRGEIVVAALLAESAHRFPQPNDASDAPVPGRLGDYLASIFAAVAGDTGALLKGLVADAQLDVGFAALFRERFIAGRRDALRRTLRHDPRTAALDEARLDLLLDVAFGVMWYRLLVDHAPIDAALARTLEETLVGLAQS